MDQTKCNGCSCLFKGNHGLSNHFQHSLECKTVHLELVNEQPKVSVGISQTDGDRRMKFVTTETTNDYTISDFNLTNEEDSHVASISECDPFNIKPNNLVDEQLHYAQSTEDSDPFVYTNEIRVENNLLKLVTDLNVPNYAFEKIMDWARDAYSSGYQFNPRATNYKSQIKQMQNFSNLKYIRPHIKQAKLPNKRDEPSDTTSINVVCCDFTSMLFSLLQDTNINKNENLVVNASDPFSKYVSPNGKLGEVNSGKWYQQAYDSMVKDENKDFLLPIIFAMDKTTISNTAHMSVYAVMFTTTIFDWKTHAHAWRPLGYIPIEKNSYFSAQWRRMDSVLKSTHENLLYSTVLQVFNKLKKKEHWTMMI